MTVVIGQKPIKVKTKICEKVLHRVSETAIFNREL
jgi:hypothetical protein